MASAELGMFGHRMMWCSGEGPRVGEQIESDSSARCLGMDTVFLFFGRLIFVYLSSYRYNLRK